MLRAVACSLCLFASLLGGCGPTSEQFDLRLREMAGADERGLLGRMGRSPDNSYQLDDNTKVLQWRWDTSYIPPGMPAMYQRVGGLWMPLEILPSFVQHVSVWLPTYHMSQLGLGALMGEPMMDHVGALLAATTVTAALAAMAYRSSRE